MPASPQHNETAQTRTDVVLAEPLAAYFRASNTRDVDALAACFANDAIVIDERQTRRGAATIREWIEETHEKYQVKAEVIDAVEQDGRTIVTGLVSGNFPSSPARLRYAFTIGEAGAISHLEIN